MNANKIRNELENEEIDYVMLKSILANYSNPRDKISRLLKNGDLIRVKKGFYVFGREIAYSPWSLETLANWIYGPSALSLEYALSWYGLIPERAKTITSITTGRSKKFKTPVGIFTYTYQNPRVFAEGIAIVQADANHKVLMATREKALVDHLILNKCHPPIENSDELFTYLIDSLRIDIQSLSSFNLMQLKELYAIHKRPIVLKLIAVIQNLKKRR